MSNDLQPALRHDLAPRTFGEAIEFAKLLSQSAFVPKEFKGKPGDILAAIQFGFELGVGPMQALQNIAVINGKPSVYGDLALALVQGSGLLEYIEETDDGRKAICKVKRRGEPKEHIVTFSDDDAKQAGLLDKPGPWKQYRSRMRMFRARGFALRDKFADVLKGVITREEAEDYPVERDVTPSPIPANAAEQLAAPEQHPSDAVIERQLLTDKATKEQRVALMRDVKARFGENAGKQWLEEELKTRGKKGDALLVQDVREIREKLLNVGTTPDDPVPPADDDDPGESFTLQGEE